jgi:hypothetical protein
MEAPVRWVRTTSFPEQSRLHAELGRASFHDAFEAGLSDDGMSALEIAVRLLAATPEWVEALLAVRNRLAALAGLKDVGRLGALDARAPADYAAGDRLSLFEIVSITPDELVLAADDRHLDARVAFLKRRRGGRASYVVCTLVTTHNRLGRLYMAPVGPIHALIVRRAMANLAI